MSEFFIKGTNIIKSDNKTTKSGYFLAILGFNNHWDSSIKMMLSLLKKYIKSQRFKGKYIKCKKMWNSRYFRNIKFKTEK